MSALLARPPALIFAAPTAKGDDARMKTLKGGLAR